MPTGGTGPPRLLRTFRVQLSKIMTPTPILVSTGSKGGPSKGREQPCLTQLEMLDSLDDFLGNVGLFAEVDMLLSDQLDIVRTGISQTSPSKVPDKIYSDFTTVSLLEETQTNQNQNPKTQTESEYKHDELGTALSFQVVPNYVANTHDRSRTASVTKECYKSPDPLRIVSRNTEDRCPAPSETQSVSTRATTTCSRRLYGNQGDDNPLQICRSVSVNKTKKRKASSLLSSTPRATAKSCDTIETEEEMLERR